MTEREWLACTDPAPMLAFLDGKASDRKLWLFAYGTCRTAWHLLTDERCRAVIDVGERCADGQADADAYMEASRAAFWRTENDPDSLAKALEGGGGGGALRGGGLGGGRAGGGERGGWERGAATLRDGLGPA